MKKSTDVFRQQLAFVVTGAVCLLFGFCAGNLISKTAIFGALLNRICTVGDDGDVRLIAALVLCLALAALPMLLIWWLTPDYRRSKDKDEEAS